MDNATTNKKPQEQTSALAGVLEIKDVSHYQEKALPRSNQTKSDIILISLLTSGIALGFSIVTLLIMFFTQ